MTTSDDPTGSDPQQGQSTGAKTGPSEDMKKKFREALDRKNGQHHATVEASTGAKINHEHGSASQKREFRRKSG
ncbi:DUF5302 domain-containing protein [Paeniglutamicibacter antarcticus]|uniref:DUF5302 domain-containing protein n=1 Tax=Arthrobacter terrae TaxID=2935737 RepID=A0A931CJ87_9MICC|nr:DUF5302 domain-containing protein [Arthrobacter terrae]MBG0739338.1 DUF5302 domain-containing protein [Arthrobacter terrae]